MTSCFDVPSVSASASRACSSCWSVRTVSAMWPWYQGDTNLGIQTLGPQPPFHATPTALSLGGWAQARQRSASEASESSLLRNRLTPPGTGQAAVLAAGDGASAHMISTIIVSDSASKRSSTTGGVPGGALGRLSMRDPRAIATRALTRATMKARRYPPSRASTAELPEASSEAVWPADTAPRIATESAPDTCWDQLTMPEPIPASLAGTPAKAMVSKGVNAVAAPKPISSTAAKIWGK